MSSFDIQIVTNGNTEISYDALSALQENTIDIHEDIDIDELLGKEKKEILVSNFSEIFTSYQVIY